MSLPEGVAQKDFRAKEILTHYHNPCNFHSTMQLASPFHPCHALQYQQVLVEIQAKIVDTSRQLALVKQQLATTDRARKMTSLTLRELESLAPEVAAYRSVGKM
ncbi:hypothetical protein BDK51DRAFT_48921 [Blyttiomyces helicus]|uniref:Uncharacterized protein n=1 Tax=Blyttiomyces helicus TaxID=388810 RepID=A0A4P9W1D6_9FUNG|nr:hypothetical protein BDK51DRAFT_48921 [Blyttiomyces helicus]|eukprot:RKO84528.1 hypothetical protein BDK51DRAFT_48921 [Blyttiomyces helicus]